MQHAAGLPVEQQRNPVYFEDVRLITPENPHRIDMVRAANSPDPPEAMRVLMSEIGQTARLISKVFDYNLDERKRLFEALHMTADLGIRGPGYSVEAALANLVEIKGHVEDEFPAVRDYFWRRNGWFVLATIILFVPGAILFYGAQHGLWGLAPPDPKGNFDKYAAVVIALLWIPFGVTLGLFLEFSFRVDRELSYGELLQTNPARWRPEQLLINTMLTAYCFAAVMGIGAFQIGVLNVLLNEFITTRPVLSIGVGFVTGFSFPYVRDLLYKFRPAQK